MSNSGSINIDLTLNVIPFQNNIKAVIAFLQSFKTSAEDIMNLKPGNSNQAIDKLTNAFKAYETEIKKTEDALKKETAEEKNAAIAKGKHGETIVTLQSRLQNVALRVQGFQSILTMLRSTFGELLSEYNKQEIALAKLQQGLKNVGEGAASMNKLTSQASNLQKITPFSDEDINNAQATLTTFQKSSDEISILIPRVLDLAAARMQDGDAQVNLSDIARVLGKVNEENLQVLKRYGIIISDTDEKMLKSLKGTEQAEYLAGLLEKRVGGMAETIGNTAAGKIKIFQNQIGEMKESLGGIISTGLQPFLNIFKPIVEWIAKAPPYVQVLAVGILALAAAFVVLNFSMGGIPYIIGGIITGIGMLIALVSDAGTSFDELKTSVDETQTSIQSSAGDIANLKQLQSELASSNTLTADEQAKLNAKLQEAAALHPEIVTGIDAQTGALITTSAALKEVIEREEFLQKLRSDVAISDQIELISKLVEEHGDEIETQGELIERIKALKKEKEGLLQLDKDAVTIMDTGLTATYETNAQALKRVEDNITSLSKELEQSGRHTQKLNLYFNEAINTGIKFGNINELLSRIKVHIQDNTQAAKLFKDSFMGLSAAAAGEMLGIQNALSSNISFMKQWTLVFMKWKQAVMEGNEKAAMIALTVLQTMTKVGKMYQAPKTETPTDTKKGSTGTGSTGTTKQEKEEELNFLEEWRKKEAELKSEIAELQALLKEPMTGVELIKVLEKISEKTEELRKHRSTGLDKLEAKTIDITKGEDIKRIQWSKEVDEEITQNRIALIEDEFERRKAEINNAYKLELKRIDELADASPEQKGELRDLAKKKRIQQDLSIELDRQKQSYNEMQDVLGGVSGLVSAIGNKLGEGGKNFVSWMQTALGVVKTIFNAMSNAESEGGFGIDDIFSIFTGILGFLAEGGPAKSNKPYIVGELGPELFIPSTAGTVIPNHILKFLQNGTDWSSNYRAMGGAVRAIAASPQTMVVIPDVRVTGENLDLVFKRYNKSQAFRKK